MIRKIALLVLSFSLTSITFGDDTQDLLSGLIDKYTGLTAVKNKSIDIIQAQSKSVVPIVQAYIQILQDQYNQGGTLPTSAQLPPHSRIESLSYDPSTKVITLTFGDNNHAFTRNQKIALKPVEANNHLYFNSLHCQTTIANFVETQSSKSTIIRSIFDFGDHCTIINNPEDFSQETDEDRSLFLVIKDNRPTIVQQQLKGVGHYIEKLSSTLEDYDEQYNIQQNPPNNNAFSLSTSGYVQEASHDQDGHIFIQLKSSGISPHLANAILELSPSYENGSYNYSALSCTTNIKNIYTTTAADAFVYKVSDASLGIGPCYYHANLSMP